MRTIERKVLEASRFLCGKIASLSYTLEDVCHERLFKRGLRAETPCEKESREFDEKTEGPQAWFVWHGIFVPTTQRLGEYIASALREGPCPELFEMPDDVLLSRLDPSDD